ncbi:MAG TPA: tetratricopeptide repeat protein [Caulobacteraceae bacterium]|nr:tetratricopeptide repeat protein [Caulobacteraceae bacterium]
MRKASMAFALAAGLGLVAIPAATIAMGSGGMGGGGMPSGGSGGGMGGMPDEPQYDPAVEYQHGTADLQAGRYKAAVQDFQHVVDVTPRAANAWLYLGMSKSGAGDERGAEKAYERSVKLDDTSIQAHRELALSLIKLKQNDKANAELATLKTRAAACNDTCADATELKSAIDAVTTALGGATPAAASAAPAHLSLATPEAGDGAYVRAVSLINERRWDDALASLDAAEAAIGPHPDILTYKGYVWRKKGDWAKAESFYHQALAIDPNHRGATEYYGELKVLEGDMSGAKALLARLDSACAFGCAEAEELRLWIDRGGDPAA